MPGPRAHGGQRCGRREARADEAERGRAAPAARPGRGLRPALRAPGAVPAAGAAGPAVEPGGRISAARPGGSARPASSPYSRSSSRTSGGEVGGVSSGDGEDTARLRCVPRRQAGLLPPYRGPAGGGPARFSARALMTFLTTYSDTECGAHVCVYNRAIAPLREHLTCWASRRAGSGGVLPQGVCARPLRQGAADAAAVTRHQAAPAPPEPTNRAIMSSSTPPPRRMAGRRRSRRRGNHAATWCASQRSAVFPSASGWRGSRRPKRDGRTDQEHERDCAGDAHGGVQFYLG